jgi:hypothetical protein
MNNEAWRRLVQQKCIFLSSVTLTPDRESAPHIHMQSFAKSNNKQIVTNRETIFLKNAQKPCELYPFKKYFVMIKR